MTNKELSDKLNIGLKTVYTWKETRKELMHYVQKGIEYENLKNNMENMTVLNINSLQDKVNEMREDLEQMNLYLEFIKNKLDK